MKALALALLLASTATSAAKGPPWISIETKPNGGTTAIVARTWHHGTAMGLPLTGTAEGIVNGRWVTVPLRFELLDSTSMNVFAVPNTWGSAGVWVLSISLNGEEHGSAGVVVGIDRQGQVAFVRFPRGRFGSRAATTGEVTALLRALDAGTA
jgi:hypothetical protein